MKKRVFNNPEIAEIRVDETDIIVTSGQEDGSQIIVEDDGPGEFIEFGE